MPVLILTAKDWRRRPCCAASTSAPTDYLAKPFALEELKAACTRRWPDAGRWASPSVIGDAAALATIGSAEWRASMAPMLELVGTPSLRCSSCCTQRADRTVSKTQLLDHMCEWGEEVSTNAIEVYVHRLRRKLEAAGVEIVTTRGHRATASGRRVRPEARSVSPTFTAIIEGITACLAHADALGAEPLRVPRRPRRLRRGTRCRAGADRAITRQSGAVGRARQP
jgi:two-component system OmpR family response regulator